jgi:ABC-type sugar transport system ATPase subunit
MKPIIEIKELIMRYDNLKVLDIPHFVVYENERLGIIGSNGAGKSTLLRLIIGLEKPTSGKILFEGEELSRRRACQAMAIVFSDTLLFNRNVEENIKLGLKIRGYKKEEADRLCKKWLCALEIAHLKDRPKDKLSTGQIKRVALAMALALQPKVLLLDEPFSYLDNQIKEKLINQLKEILFNTKTTLIFVSHDKAELESLCTRIIFLKDGKLQ